MEFPRAQEMTQTTLTISLDFLEIQHTHFLGKLMNFFWKSVFVAAVKGFFKYQFDYYFYFLWHVDFMCNFLIFQFTVSFKSMSLGFHCAMLWIFLCQLYLIITIR